MTITGAQILNSAFKYSGVPYSQRNPQGKNGMDCSGIVQAAMHDLGVEIPRTTSTQLAAATGKGQVIGKSLSAAVQGDVIHYVGHEEIYIGGGKVFSEATSGTSAAVRDKTNMPIIGIVRYADGGPGARVGSYGAIVPNDPNSNNGAAGPGTDPGKVSGQLIDIVPDTVKNIWGVISSLGKFIDKASDPGFWLRVAAALGGVIAMVIGLLALMKRGSVGGATKTVTKTVANGVTSGN
jgi:hypothetical protein